MNIFIRNQILPYLNIKFHYLLGQKNITNKKYLKPTIRVERPHVGGFVHIVRSYLNLMLQGRIWESVKKQLIDCHVEGRNHFLRVVDQLTIQILVKLFQVTTVHIQEWLTNSIDLWKIQKFTVYLQMDYRLISNININSVSFWIPTPLDFHKPVTSV